MATLQPTADETKLEIWTVVVLGLVSLITAWAAFQSSLWSGAAVDDFARADAQRTVGVNSFDSGTSTFQDDRSLFLEYYRALDANNLRLANYIKSIMMTERLRNPVALWEKAPNYRDISPFRPQFGYERPGANIESVQQNVTKAMGQARHASSLGDKYNLVAVLLAASLFLAGISSTLRFQRFRISLLTIGTLIFIASTLWMLTLQVRNPL